MNSKENEKKARIQTFDVYVGHLPKVINQDKLKKVFSRYGEIVDVFCRHGNGPLGYAIVKFKIKEDVDRLLKEVDKVHVNGYEMEVKSGTKNNQGVENGNGAFGKTVTFAQPLSFISTQGINVHVADNNLKSKDGKFMTGGQNETNGQQTQVVEIICTNVDSAVTFHGCSVYRFEDLQNISLKLNSICPNLVRLNRKPLMKRVYGALYEDFRWYRCTVRQVMVPSRPGVCIVEYIDYGNIAEVFYTNMVDLPEPLQKICPFAMKCVLSNLMCSPNCHSDVSYLHHLVNKRMTLSASLSSFSGWGVPEYQVFKCSSNGIDVVNELVRNGYAVYRSQMSIKSSPPLHNPENPGSSKSQENHKPKKASTNKAFSKKVTIKETCNGVEKHPNEVSNGAFDDALKSPKSASPEDSQLSDDFVPKRIIKRGSDIADMTSVPVFEGSKSVNRLLKVDCVLANLKLVNNIRNLISFPADDSLIDNAVELLMTEVTDNVSQEQKTLLESANKKYNEALVNIKDCTDQKLLPDLKEARNHEKNELLNVLKEFFESFDCSLPAKQKKIQELITSLESNSNAWMNVCLSSLPDTIEELLIEYHKEREVRWSSIQKARENTNQKHKKFMEFLGDFRKEFSLNMLDGSSSSNHLDNCGGKRGSYALKFEEALSDLGTSLEEEMKTCSVTKGRSYVPIIKCVLEKLDVPKERIDNECEIYMKYKSLYDDLSNLSNLSPLFEELSSVKTKIQTLTLDCGDDKEKIHERLFELHNDLLQEDILLAKLAKVSAIHFPELILDHPELNLREYQNNWYLLKSNWQKSYFPALQDCRRIESSYISKLSEDSIVIKEFDISCDAEKAALIKEAILWNEIKSKSLVKIKALFNKGEKGICAMFSEVWETLYDNPLSIPIDNKMACTMLRQILKGLFDIHERGMTHGAVHPLAVLRKDGKVLLDFNYKGKLPEDCLCLKGINFQDPCEDFCNSADMYGFGCLVLWMHFPNLSFSSDDSGVPNILAFQSIIQELLSDSDFTDLSNLLNPNHHLRPTSKDLYKKGFLKDLRIVPKSKP